MVPYRVIAEPSTFSQQVKLDDWRNWRFWTLIGKSAGHRSVPGRLDIVRQTLKGNILVVVLSLLGHRVSVVLSGLVHL